MLSENLKFFKKTFEFVPVGTPIIKCTFPPKASNPPENGSKKLHLGQHGEHKARDPLHGRVSDFITGFFD